MYRHSGTDLGLGQGLYLREVMSWYATDGVAFIAGAIAQHEPWSIEAWPSWHWDLGGSTSSRLSQRWAWDPGIGGSSHVWNAWRNDVDQWFIWDLSISL